MYTTVAWYEAATKALAAIDAVADEHITYSGDDITIPIGLGNVVAVQAAGQVLTRAQLVSPSLRGLFLEEIQPFASITEPLPTGEEHEWVNRFSSPMPLVESEKLNAYVTNTYTDKAVCVVAMLADGPLVPVTGNIRTIRATGAADGDAGTWVSTPLSLAQTLPAGRYQVVGFRCVDDTGIAARLLFVGGTWRPGAFCAPSTLMRNDNDFRMGRAGVMGEFEFDQQPQMEVLCSATGGVQEVFLDLIQVRAGRA